MAKNETKQSAEVAALAATDKTSSASITTF